MIRFLIPALLTLIALLDPMQESAACAVNNAGIKCLYCLNILRNQYRPHNESLRMCASTCWTSRGESTENEGRNG